MAFLCSTVATPFDQHNLAKALRRTLTKAKLSSKHSPYDLRHTYATLLLARGVPITYVAKQLGHSKSTTTLQWYAHWLPTENADYVDRLDATMEEKAKAAARALPRQFGSTFGSSGAARSEKLSAPGRIRTCDPLIRSQVL
jgi:hypothetical protein